MWWLGRVSRYNLSILDLERVKTRILILLTQYELTNYFLCADMLRTEAERATKKKKRELAKLVLQKKEVVAQAIVVKTGEHQP